MVVLRPSSRSIPSCALPLLTGGLICISGAAFAQGSAQSDALSGPKVKDNSVPGQVRQFGGKGAERGQPRPLPPGLFMRALEGLSSPDIAQNLRLSDAQRTQLEQIRRDFESKLVAFRQEHQQELETLREHLPAPERRRVDGFLRGPGQGRKAGATTAPNWADRPRQDAMMDDDAASTTDQQQAATARARVKELMDAAPKPAASQQAAMAVLSAEQQDWVKAQIERLRAESRPGMGAGDGPKDAERGSADRRSGDDRAAMRARLMEQLSPEEREKLASMSPEQRREFMRSKMGQRAGGKGASEGSPEPKDKK